MASVSMAEEAAESIKPTAGEKLPKTIKADCDCEKKRFTLKNIKSNKICSLVHFPIEVLPGVDVRINTELIWIPCLVLVIYLITGLFYLTKALNLELQICSMQTDSYLVRQRTPRGFVMYRFARSRSRGRQPTLQPCLRGLPTRRAAAWQTTAGTGHPESPVCATAGDAAPQLFWRPPTSHWASEQMCQA